MALARPQMARDGTLSRSSAPRSSIRISVIVIAHSRREFLREAVESVVRQDFPPDQREILVVKNFEDEELDAYLTRVGAVVVLSPEDPAPRKVLAGFQRSHGSILTFLEDDDMFEPGRLRAVDEAFRANPGLGLYRNRFSYVGADGASLPASSVRAFGLRRTGEAPTVLMADRDKPGRARWLAGQFPDFNISSCAVARATMEPVVPYLMRMSSSIDTLLFFAALVLPFSILFDGASRTRYRVHSLNASLAGGGTTEDRKQRLRLAAQRFAADYAAVRQFVADSQRSEFLKLIDARIWVNQLTMAFRAPRSHRRDFARLLRGLPTYFDTYPVQEDLLGVVGIVPFLASPTLGRRLYARQRSIV